MQFYGTRKITLNYALFIYINGSWQCFTNEDFYEWFQLCLLFNPFQNDSLESSIGEVIFYCFPKWFVDFWMTFWQNSSRISCQIIFINKHWLQSCSSPFNVETKLIINSFMFMRTFRVERLTVFPFYLQQSKLSVADNYNGGEQNII